MELPGIEPGAKERRPAETLNLTTRKYVKRRESTWEYAKDVDGINKFTNPAQVDTLHLRHAPRGFRAPPTSQLCEVLSEDKLVSLITPSEPTSRRRGGWLS